jgi:hypothetical protein
VTEPTRKQVNDFARINGIKIIALLSDESAKITDSASSGISLGLITLTRAMVALMIEYRNDGILLEITRQLSEQYREMKSNWRGDSNEE